MSKELEKKSEELEQTLTKQLELLKKDSEEWLKLGAAVAVGVLLVYGIAKVTRKKKVKTTDKALEVLEKEGLLNEEIKKRLTQPKPSTFWPNLTQRLVILGLALAKDKIYNQIFSSSAEDKAGENSK
ncbi:hypothetical protein [Algoriphagus boritolerans]|uniref:Uncharacterized protein n=1 Tax=Algoriphagus boritolerans DSM 17298 = JCM 18970 TaxID=1120964 RepID=A0A1H5YX59_9BACT|nr:hypothetical protein [Algoriphagus boritolerans]SEG28382.1 hypothetical protein SAMN03080598_03208 [Algoriphagus boritolerans DSM 17298 = JCM 18970]